MPLPPPPTILVSTAPFSENGGHGRRSKQLNDYLLMMEEAEKARLILWARKSRPKKEASRTATRTLPGRIHNGLRAAF